MPPHRRPLRPRRLLRRRRQTRVRQLPPLRGHAVAGKGRDPVTTCLTCHGKDGLHGLDCGFTSVRPHITHHDDCGCRSAEYERCIAELEAALAERDRMLRLLVRMYASTGDNPANDD